MICPHPKACRGNRRPSVPQTLDLEVKMRLIALVLCVLAFAAAPSHAAQSNRVIAQDVASMEKKCRAMVGREVPEATDGRSHEGQLNVQRFSDCMMGAPRIR